MVRDLTLEQQLEAILEKTMAALQDGRQQMFAISETASSEYQRIQLAIEELQFDVQRCHEDVDELESLFQNRRQRLFEVNQGLDRFSDEQRQEAYEAADAVRERLAQAREREQQLRMRRNELEESLERIKELVERAEALVAQVGVAVDFLVGNMAGINRQMEDLRLQRLMGRKIIQVQEEERKRVAREIHDGPAQDLANVVLKADLAEKMLLRDDGPQAVAELQELKELIKASLRDVRRIMFNLRPMALDDLGLIPTLKRYLNEQSWIQTDFHVTGQARRLPSDVEVALFRIIQEALNNTRKHAAAQNVSVCLAYDWQAVTAVVEDDGRGLDQRRRTDDADQYGLMNMRERAECLGGTLHVTSEEHGGTKIEVCLPLDTEGRTGDGQEHKSSDRG